MLKPELAAVIGAKRFLTEIRTTAKLQHPHILALFGTPPSPSLLAANALEAWVVPDGIESGLEGDEGTRIRARDRDQLLQDLQSALAPSHPREEQRGAEEHIRPAHGIGADGKEPKRRLCALGGRVGIAESDGDLGAPQ
ncbi:MAG: hypothetical protein R3324_12570, partial [Halobacteriales archaeon]|nr:hypothetical protein [Halobacteriales archaeon]